MTGSTPKAALAAIRKRALSYPEAVEDHPWGDQVIKVRGKIFVFLGAGKDGGFGMSAKQDEYAGNLSGGQKRLVEIMRALMAEPKLLLLDEPMAGVNPTLARSIENDLAALAQEGLTLLLVEHELDVVERLSDSVVAMALGKVIATGTMAELRSRREVLDAYLGD